MTDVELSLLIRSVPLKLSILERVLIFNAGDFNSGMAVHGKLKEVTNQQEVQHQLPAYPETHVF